MLIEFNYQKYMIYTIEFCAYACVYVCLRKFYLKAVLTVSYPTFWVKRRPMGLVICPKKSISRSFLSYSHFIANNIWDSLIEINFIACNNVPKILPVIFFSENFNFLSCCPVYCKKSFCETMKVILCIIQFTLLKLHFTSLYYFFLL